MKWLVILLIAVGIYYASQNWSSISSQWNDEFSRITGTTPSGTLKKVTGNSAFPLTLFESWEVRNVAGVRAELPFPMQSFKPAGVKTPPANLRMEFYEGKAGTREVMVAHGKVINMAGAMSLSAFNHAFAATIEKEAMDVISENTATTLLNGFRVQRSDYVSKASPRVRARCALYERGSELWFLAVNTPESDAAGENVFQRIAQSVR